MVASEERSPWEPTPRRRPPEDLPPAKRVEEPPAREGRSEPASHKSLANAWRAIGGITE